jgi:hypothetical protein
VFITISYAIFIKFLFIFCSVFSNILNYLIVMIPYPRNKLINLFNFCYLYKVKNECKKYGSMKINYNKLVSETIENSSVRQIPRNYRQFVNQRSIYDQSQNVIFNTKDDYYDAIKNMVESDFVRSITFKNDSFISVCFTDQQFTDMVRFCAIGNSTINIDTTFDLGDYYVTPITFRNLALFNRSTNQHPLYLGPVMIHSKKDYYSYLHFAHSIESYYETNRNNFDVSIREVKRVVTDDDPSIRKAFELVFTKAEFMLCCNHLRKDVCHEINKFGPKAKQAKEEIVQDIFGSPGNREDSLIASKDKDDFNNKLGSLLNKWREITLNGNDIK